jgi:hypothetical protein
MPMKKNIRDSTEKFKHDQVGLAYVWAMAAIMIVLGAIIYFPLSYAYDAVYTNIVGNYTFTGTTALGITAIQLIVSYMLGFLVIFTVNWMLVQAKMQRYTE